MCPENGNGYPRWRDIERIDRHNQAQDEAVKWLSEMGQKHNEQIRALEKTTSDQAAEVVKVPVLEERLDNMLESWRATRNAMYAAAVGFFGLAGAVIWQGF